VNVCSGFTIYSRRVSTQDSPIYSAIYSQFLKITQSSVIWHHVPVFQQNLLPPPSVYLHPTLSTLIPLPAWATCCMITVAVGSWCTPEKEQVPSKFRSLLTKLNSISSRIFHPSGMQCFVAGCIIPDISQAEYSFKMPGNIHPTTQCHMPENSVSSNTALRNSNISSS